MNRSLLIVYGWMGSYDARIASPAVITGRPTLYACRHYERVDTRAPVRRRIGLRIDRGVGVFRPRVAPDGLLSELADPCESSGSAVDGCSSSSITSLRNLIIRFRCVIGVALQAPVSARLCATLNLRPVNDVV